MRQIHNLIQGSPEWHEHRAKCFNASDAAAMLGVSSYKSRDQLLLELATGIKPEVDAQTQKRFDRGHQIEAAARPLAEKIIGDDLYPATVTLEIDGLLLSASCDGLTMDEEIEWECKTLNQDLEASLSIGVIPAQYHPQLEQQLLVTGASKALFMASDGEREISAWYFPDLELRAKIVAGWKQFEVDLANFEAPAPQAPKSVAEPVKALPAINYKIDFTKGLSIVSNLEGFKTAAQELVEKSKSLLVTDQDFEDAKARVKSCETAESNIKSLIDRVLGELGDVNTFKSDLESIGGWIRQSRLNQEKQIKDRSASRKAEIINAGKAAVAEYISSLNAALGSVQMPAITIDFDAAVYRKSSFDSMQSAVNDALANFKIEATQISTKILANLAVLRELASTHTFLFSDRQQLVLKDKEYVEAVAKSRIAEHEKAEKARIDAEAQRLAAIKIAEEKAEQERLAAQEKAEQERLLAEQIAPVETPIPEVLEPIAETAANIVQMPPARRGRAPQVGSAQLAPVAIPEFQITVDVKTVAKEISLGRVSADVLIGNELNLQQLALASYENGVALTIPGVTVKRI